MNFPKFLHKQKSKKYTYILLVISEHLNQAICYPFLLNICSFKQNVNRTHLHARTHTRTHVDTRVSHITHSLTDCKIQKRIFFDFRVKFVILFCCYRYELIFLILILSFYYPCRNKKNCFDFFYKKILRGLRQSRKSVPFTVIVCEKIFFVSCFRQRSSAHVPFCPATTNVSIKANDDSLQA